MAEIIRILEDEHQQIEKALEGFLHQGTECRTDTKALGGLETLVLNHVSKEDAEIYRPLRSLARLAPEAENFLAVSEKNLKDLKISAVVFFEKYKGENNPFLCNGFLSDVKRLHEKIRERIIFEDEELFPFLRNFWSKL